MTARDAIANCLLMGRGMYPSPEEWADAVLKRLAHEGFAVVSVERAKLLQKFENMKYFGGMEIHGRMPDAWKTLEEKAADE